MALPTRTGSPWDQLRELRDRMDELMSTAFGTGPRLAQWSPPVNIEDVGSELILTAELPGMTRDDIEIELENNVLTIRGEKKIEREEKGEEGRRYIYERSSGSFSRSFTLPHTVAADRITAKFEDGVLTVTMPKTEEARARHITIQ